MPAGPVAGATEVSTGLAATVSFAGADWLASLLASPP